MPCATELTNTTGHVTRARIEPVGRRLLTVVRVEDVTPHYRRIVLGGPEVEGFSFARFACGDHVKVVVPDEATGDIVLPQPTPQGPRLPDGSRPVMRDYTVRAWDGERCELTLDFVVHEHGPAGRWAARAAAGDRIGVLGPRGHVLFPQNYPVYLAVGDATALPAIARLLEELPEGARAVAFVAVADGEEQDLAVRAGSELTWVPQASGALEAAVRSWRAPHDGDWFAFAAGEAGVMTAIRRYLRHEVGLPKEQVDVDGYWKAGVAGLDHHTVTVGDD
ncbi:siderophore-interacting protein [Xylanimonas ulmi]|uniref:NADPH-dependent ferric siderophore reductase n=1 Tax=Xylanimonas ulmi TaxID=228973 RepID=A0A4V2EXV2_9MICO|nr:siderophore-interacting protein [Xylanibacterium ulmi]RZS60780.1 NADPH-dependent ferric siderophore reductase [Xylanibacterium ulmi]